MSERLPTNLLANRVLQVCVRHLGDVEVARRVGVTPALLETWRTGQAPMPQREFRMLVDVLVVLAPGWEDWDK